MELEKIEEKVKEALLKGRAIATGVGIFAAICEKNGILLRRRVEEESLLKKDLSGKWELPGGTVELNDFGEEYQSAVKNALAREVREETELEIEIKDLPLVLLPAILKKSSIEKLGLIDWAFVVPIDAQRFTKATEKYGEKLRETREIDWVLFEKIKEIDVVSERMRYLINIAIDYYRSLKT